MTKLQELYERQGQSPWLDNLTRPCLRDGTLGQLVAAGIRGVTAWLGGLLGLLHVAVALTVLVPLLAGVHPRMASPKCDR